MYCHVKLGQLDSGKTRTCSPGAWRPLYKFHSSGRCRRESHWENSSRSGNTRSLARAFSSSRGGRRRGHVELLALDPLGEREGLEGVAGAVGAFAQHRGRCSPVRRPHGRSPCRSTARSRYSRTSGGCARCRRAAAKGTAAGANAFSARCSMTMESLPPENRITGRSNSPATSRKMCTASDSSASRWDGRTDCPYLALLDLGDGRHASPLSVGSAWTAAADSWTVWSCDSMRRSRRLRAPRTGRRPR